MSEIRKHGPCIVCARNSIMGVLKEPPYFFIDSPGLREAIERECEALWSIEAHAKRIAEGTEKPL